MGLNTERANKLRLQFPVGQRVELISVEDTAKLIRSAAYPYFGFTEDDIRERKKYPIIPTGTPGVVQGVDDNCKIEVLWDTGAITKIAAGVDFIRAVNIQVIVRRPDENFHMTSWELAQWANTVNKIAGGKGTAFSSLDFPERLKGHHCSCGVTQEGFTKGIFKLLPVTSEEVQSGGKAYMTCIKCGGWSHL